MEKFPAIMGPALTAPSGTVTFLFTDIEGSTVRWDRDATAMQAAVRRHDELMRESIGAYGGHVFKTIGDAFCAAFHSVEDAVHAALDAQHRLATEDFSKVDGIRARMALHVGASDERDGDYFGPTLNRVARLLAIGHGGQVLLSGAAAEAVKGGVELRDLGEHRLKDLTAPEHVFQLIAASLQSDFPRLRSLSVLKNNLPLQLTSLVGRDHDIADIKAALTNARLLTLLGAGGVGKTRCALQAGAEMLDSFEDGVWFIDLASLSDAALVPSVIAATFELQESISQPMIDVLAAHLKQRHLLVILDNCEHLIHEVATTAETLLRTCPRLSLLSTSREALGVRGESVHRLPSLAVPPPRKELRAHEAREFGSVALFEARARAANPRFELLDDNAAIVGEICRRLDGIPLAIELAAARIRVLSPGQLAQKLDERFRLLTGGDRTALPRQQTMRALIDWSYDLLNPAEQKLLRALSVFAGSFVLDRVVGVCGDGDASEFELLDLLTSLVDKSLVNTEYTATAETRYRLLESTRQYAHEKLMAAGELDLTRQRHADTYVGFAERLDDLWDATPDAEWTAQAEPELDNWRATLEWAAGRPDRAALLQRLGSVKLWQELAPAEGRRLVRAALDAVDDQTPQLRVAQLELAASKLDSIFGHFRPALESALRALAVFEQLGDPVCIANAELCAGRALLFLHRIAEGEAKLRAAMTVFRETVNQKTMGSALSALGAAKIMEGDIPAARELLMSAGAIYKSMGADGRLPAVLSLLAEAEFRAGDVDAALRVAGEALEAHRQLRSGPNVINLLYNIAAYLTALERYDDARIHAREALELARGEQAEADVAFTLQHLAAIGALSDVPDESSRLRAARILGFVDARLAALEATREYTEQVEYERMRGALHAALDAERLDKLIEEGRAWNEERAIAEALSL